MKKILLGLVAVGMSILQYLGFFVPPASADRAKVDEAALRELLAQRSGDFAVRSDHPAVDRLLAEGDQLAQTAGHDKSTFDKDYDKAYDRSTYSKTYEKTN
ncbi:MAG TPA: hypothetical protein VIY51_08745 [Xanthobacteraceae bacterium]